MDLKESLNTPEEIIEAFHEPYLRKAAYHAAFERKQDAVPAFIGYIEAATEANDVENVDDFGVVYWLICLLAEWRETKAYRPIARFFQCEPQFVEELLDDAITEERHRLIASVFDGDPSVLFDIIDNENTEEYIRSGMFDALVIVGLTEPGHLDAIGAFAKRFATSHFARAPNVVWMKWAECVGLLGFQEMTQLVRYMFTAGRITDDLMEFRHFEQDLKKGLDPRGGERTLQQEYYKLWDDTVDFFPSEDEARHQERRRRFPNRTRRRKASKLGRNDPCTCGSGKKYKHCCG
ncbi:MAG: DUF1186 domain-containing protein [Rhodobacter sp.]|nr:DUF1186 domain-containing protein [Rhodobacter sp.]MCY4167454.1 DUF1186 domain-containing protein [Rhodobacter sp.]MCY4241209.1 DUF1186 domain-containing protein [Rhodobacter sp.]